MSGGHYMGGKKQPAIPAAWILRITRNFFGIYKQICGCLPCPFGFCFVLSEEVRHGFGYERMDGNHISDVWLVDFAIHSAPQYRTAFQEAQITQRGQQLVPAHKCKRSKWDVVIPNI